MAINVWGVVGGNPVFLPLTALLGTAGQLLGMNAAATAAEWKALTFNTATNQLAGTVASAVSPLYTFTGDLDTGIYQDGANILGLSAGGVRRLQISTTVALFTTDVQLASKLLKEDFSADIIAASNIDLSTATGNYVRITNAAGAINLSDLGGATIPAGTCMETEFVVTGGSVILIYDANKIDLPSATNLPLQNRDIIRWRKTNDASAFWKLVSFSRGLNSSSITNPGDLIVGTTSGGSTIAGIVSAGAAGQTIAIDTNNASRLIYIDNPSRPNLLINPNWHFDQINEGALYTVNAADVNGPDGWSGSAIGTGIFKLRTVVDPDNIAFKCLEITCTTADAAIAAADSYFLYSAIEGYDSSILQFGTASPTPCTIQFKFKSTVIGVYGISIENSASNRRYIGTITVPDVNEHEYSLSFIPDTAGVWTYTNGVGLYLVISLAAGTNFQAAINAWGAGNEKTTAAQVNFMSNVANIAYLKRIQFIPGALVQAYRPADVQKELEKVQRYYEKTFNLGVAVAQNTGTTTGQIQCRPGVGAANVFEYWLYKIVKRIIPAMVAYNPYAANAQIRNISTGADCSGTGFSQIGVSGTGLSHAGDAGSVASHDLQVHLTANARLS